MNTAALGRALRRTPPHLILLLGRARARTSTRSSRAWTRRSRRCARHIPRPSCSPGRCTSSPPSPTGRATIAGSLASSQDAGLSPRCAARRRPGRRWRPYLLSRETEAQWTPQHPLTSQPERVARGMDACRATVRLGTARAAGAEETTAGAEAGAVAGLIETVIDRAAGVALAHKTSWNRTKASRSSLPGHCGGTRSRMRSMNAARGCLTPD